jgi:hypothetical protein
MNQLDLAIHSTVHDYADGTQALADSMGMSRQILINKACSTTENAYFSPAQMAQLQNITGNYAINDALSAMEQHRAKPEKDLTSSVLMVSKDFAGVVTEVTEAMADNVMTERERRQCLDSVNQLLDDAEQLKHSISREGLESKIHAV